MEIEEGCFEPYSTTASEYAQRHGGKQLYAWAFSHDEGFLREHGFHEQLLPIGDPGPSRAISPDATVTLTGRVVKKYPAWTERYLGGHAPRVMAEARITTRSYLVHDEIIDPPDWSAKLPPRCRIE